MKSLMLWGVAMGLLSLATVLSADPVVFVDQGKPRGQIVLPEQASPAETFAAEELQRYVEQSTGARLPIVTEDAVGEGPRLEVGRTAEAATLDFEPDRAFPDPYIIHAAGSTVTVLGKGDRGTLYAAYDLLRRELGCRWIMPGPLGEIVPQRDRLAVEQARIEETPAFRFRIAAGFARDEYLDWAIKNRLQIMSASPNLWTNPEMIKRGGYVMGTMHHAFDALLPEDEYFAEHPEYFGMLGGRRVAGRGSQLCLSNPDVADLVTRAAIAYFDEHPDASFFSLCPNDNQNWCECDNCRALDTETMERWGRTFPVVSDRYFAFVNEVARGLANKHPDKLLYTFAYQNYTWPPKRIAPLRNVIVSLCHMVPACYSHRLVDPACPDNAEFNTLLGDWSATHENMWYYAYTCKSMWEQMPWPIARRLAHDIRRLNEAGFEGFYSQGSQSIWGQLGINFRVMAATLWDPDADTEAILEEYFRLAFGPAAQAMTEFYGTLEGAYSAPDMHVHHEVDIWGPPLLPADVRQRCEAALDQARQVAAEDDDVLARIAPVEAAYRYAALRVTGLAGEEAWRQSADAAQLARAAEAYREIIPLGGENPGGEALLAGSIRQYVQPRYDRLALPYEALFAGPEDQAYAWTVAETPTTSFEAEPGSPLPGWGTLVAAEDCGAELSDAQAATGEHSLRLWSDVRDAESPRMTALQHDWVIASALSERRPVEAGDAIVVTAQVKIPRDFEMTKRGATVGIVGYDADGESPRGWAPGSIETRLIEQTDGWRQAIVARTVDPGITQVAVRLSIAGLGECAIDDVKLMHGRKR